jgi:hypothetical protein
MTDAPAASALKAIRPKSTAPIDAKQFQVHWNKASFDQRKSMTDSLKRGDFKPPMEMKITRHMRQRVNKCAQVCIHRLCCAGAVCVMSFYNCLDARQRGPSLLYVQPKSVSSMYSRVMDKGIMQWLGMSRWLPPPPTPAAAAATSVTRKRKRAV